MAFLEHLMLQSSVVHRQLSVFQNESLHDVAVVDIDRQDFAEADENVGLYAIFRVDERCKLLREVDCFVYSYLSGLLLVFLEQESKSINNLRPGSPVGVKTGAVVEHGIIFGQLWKEIVERFDRARSENFIEDWDSCQ